MGQLSQPTIRLGASIGERIEQLKLVLNEHRAMMDELQKSTSDEIQSILEKESIKLTQAFVSSERRDAGLNAVQMRDWFLKNMGYPFPSRSDKLRILKTTNRQGAVKSQVLKYNQVVLWFINTRRRSGWTKFLRRYAQGDKTKMLELVWALETSVGGTHASRYWSSGIGPVSATKIRDGKKERKITRMTIKEYMPNANDYELEKMYSEWKKIVERIRYGVKERVGDWVEEVIGTSSDL
ncbi:Hypothetical homeodomain transcription factor bE [Malassezia sympodialis ATCC 42132]|nr:putative homeodomain transcription factor bE [Malassezia sympodialis ATCC 42132]CCU98130.1 Hypothetical homeodomain transcription factor bE [Malassezia sympodialis ATCC 42132]|eukprot:XP_018739451.1 Hypothetical homeodomain transcription factor bE [Malassezia sympodialis ATCC 42132]